VPQLIAALVNEPELLVLDEPFSGLDPISMANISELLGEVAAAGATVLFSSHQLDLVEDLCQDVVIIDHGRIVLAGDLEELRAAVTQRFVDIRYRGLAPDWSALASASAAAVDAHTGRWTLRPAVHHPLLEAVDLHGAHDFRHTFSTWLEDAGIPARVIDELMGHQPSGRAGRHEASAIGAHYRHTTPEMAARVVAAVEERLVIVLATAEAALDQQPWSR
jgi:ABC-type multidrug transport system ATPase subunit